MAHRNGVVEPLQITATDIDETDYSTSFGDTTSLSSTTNDDSVTDSEVESSNNNNNLFSDDDFGTSVLRVSSDSVLRVRCSLDVKCYDYEFVDLVLV
ncbi:hypothetical protein Tco_1205048 [Tanacetum coccineum]